MILSKKFPTRSLVGLLVAFLCITTLGTALTAKRKPGSQGGSNPMCDPDAGEKVDVVAGPRQCYCYEARAGYYTFTPFYPPGLVGTLFHSQVVVSCDPETEATNTPYNCTYRNDCMSDYEQTQPGWFYFFNSDFPIYMIEGGPGSWP
ncbi:MAG: hypothetical protein J0I17_10370 ['Candidatus Kapabacteria' thiocyanatum]|uniref:Uncharacterized protein n=1 Tax=Candidatus Kapaibacterium thiocyanatum TaxID=1895771 RepID=A0A1M3L3G1_9BACT|nr:hypothetical protein ['Candidatus Kapabacteria' thiocyanatum]OJX59898.1 MAG: hypothetical protein BGO89_07815 ['Candidatus Kapabacteria' thiocyanatum]